MFLYYCIIEYHFTNALLLTMEKIFILFGVKKCFWLNIHISIYGGVFFCSIDLFLLNKYCYLRRLRALDLPGHKRVPDSHRSARYDREWKRLCPHGSRNRLSRAWWAIFIHQSGNKGRAKVLSGSSVQSHLQTLKVEKT